MVSCIVVGLIIAATGLFVFLKPEWFWELTESWKSRSAGGPSDFYLKSTRFGGIAFMIWGIVMVLLPFVME